MRFLIVSLLTLMATAASSSPAYLKRFQYYQTATTQLSRTPETNFLSFIADDRPLSRKLREKWLYFLTQYNDWDLFIKYYKPSTDVSLQCYYAFGQYQQGYTEAAVAKAKTLWKTGESLPPACDKLFSFLLNTQDFTQKDLEYRIELALKAHNEPLSLYLLKKLNTAHAFSHQLKQVNYLSGAKQTLRRHIEQADQLWRKSKSFLTDKQQLHLLQQIILMKAAKNQADARTWLSKIKPQALDTPLMEWQIRFALKDRQWAKVLTYIEKLPNKNDPCWQYWKARALEAQQQKEKAMLIYTALSKQRHYYAFLAKTKCHQAIQIYTEQVPNTSHLLTLYTPVLNEIKTQYAKKNIQIASNMLNDFASELPKNEKIALSIWVLNTLHWAAKSVALSNDPLLIDQLSLRFPLVYQKEIHQQSQRYRIPEALIYAIIRQESGYREDVMSPAGAHGLMQLMPSTADWISKLHHIPYYNKQQLFTFSKNIHLGVAYLHHLSTHYQGRLVLVITAYNAGPTQVKSWLNTQPLTDLDIWVETIPFMETRNYVKNVIAYTLIYQYELKKTPSMAVFSA